MENSLNSSGFFCAEADVWSNNNGIITRRYADKTRRYAEILLFLIPEISNYFNTTILIALSPLSIVYTSGGTWRVNLMTLSSGVTLEYTQAPALLYTYTGLSLSMPSTFSSLPVCKGLGYARNPEPLTALLVPPSEPGNSFKRNLLLKKTTTQAHTLFFCEFVAT